MDSLGARSFKQMTDEVARKVQDPSAERIPWIQDGINRALYELAAMSPWDGIILTDDSGLRNLNQDVATFVGGESEFLLPWNAVRMMAVIDQTSGNELELVAPAYLVRVAGPSLFTTGTPTMYSIGGQTAQWQSLPQVEKVLFLAGVPNAGLSVTVYYEKAAGQSAQMHKQVMTSPDWTVGVETSAQLKAGYAINRIEIPDGWEGALSGTGADSGTSVVALQSGVEPAQTSANQLRSAARQKGRLWRVPATSSKATLVYQISPERLFADTDAPPVPCSDYLVSRAASIVAGDMNRADKAATYAAEALRLQDAFGAMYQRHDGGTYEPRDGLLEGAGMWWGY